MCEQQYQKEVWDQLKQQDDDDFIDSIEYIIGQSYVKGWEKGMKDAEELYKIYEQQLEKKNARTA